MKVTLGMLPYLRPLLKLILLLFFGTHTVFIHQDAKIRREIDHKNTVNPIIFKSFKVSYF